jgi:hypothetical protein
MPVNVFIVKARTAGEGSLVMAITLSLQDAIRRCTIIAEHSDYPSDRITIDEYPVCGQMNFTLNCGDLEVSTMTPTQSYDSFGNPMTKRQVHYS